MTDAEFEALIAELAPTRKRHNIYVGARNITYYETIEEADEEVARLKACGHVDARISTQNW